MKKLCDNLYEFDTQIYPRMLWVCVGKRVPDGIFDDVPEYDNTAFAQVDEVATVGSSGRSGDLIRFENIDAIRCGDLTHEAGHVALDIFKYIGAVVDYDNQEPFTYLLGWVGKCIGLVRDDFLKSKKLKKEDKK